MIVASAAAIGACAERVALQSQSVVAVDRRVDPGEVVFSGCRVGAGDDAEGFLFAARRIGIADRYRLVASNHFDFRRQTEQRNGCARGRCLTATIVKVVIGDRFLPSVELARFRREGGRVDRCSQSVLGDFEVLRHLDVRHIQSLADFVVEVVRAIFRQAIGDLKPWGFEQSFERVFVFEAIEAPDFRATVSSDAFAIRFEQRLRKRFEESVDFRGIGAFSLLGWHFARHHTIVYMRPPFEGLPVLQVEGKRLEIEIRFHFEGIVAVQAVILDKRESWFGEGVGKRGGTEKRRGRA